MKARSTTVIVVGHRPALLSSLDKIAVLKDGVVVAFDAAAALLPQLVAGTATAERERKAVRTAVSSIGAAA